MRLAPSGLCDPDGSGQRVVFELVRIPQVLAAAALMKNQWLEDAIVPRDRDVHPSFLECLLCLGAQGGRPSDRPDPSPEAFGIGAWMRRLDKAVGESLGARVGVGG